MDAPAKWYWSLICHMRDIPVNLADMLWTISILFFDLYPFPKQQILDSTKWKEFANDNFKFDENV